jgi:hypothetical protein
MAKTKCTTDLIEKIATDIENGCSLSRATTKNGLAQQTGANWYEWGKHSEGGKYREFYLAVQDALDCHKQKLLDKIYQIALYGAKNRRAVTIENPNGTKTSKKEICESDELRAITYLLNTRYGYDGNFRKGINKAANKIMSIVRKHTDRATYDAILESVVNDEQLGEQAELEMDLF